MIERYSNYHSMIMSPLGDWQTTTQKDTYNFLCNCTEGKTCHFGTLAFGYEVLTAYIWLKYKFESNSADMKSLQTNTSEKSLGTLSAMLKKRFQQDVLISKKTSTPCVIGGNIVLPPGIKITVRHLLRAYNLLCNKKQDPLIRFLDNVCHKTNGQVGSINSIVYTPLAELRKNNKTYLERLIEIVDFPIPSIYVLLKTLGYSYFPGNPYLDSDNEYGKCQCIIGGLADTQSGERWFRLYYTDAASKQPFSKYKFLPESLLLSMILDNTAFQPMDRLDAQELNIITNDEV